LFHLQLFSMTEYMNVNSYKNDVNSTVKIKLLINKADVITIQLFITNTSVGRKAITFSNVLA